MKFTEEQESIIRNAKPGRLLKLLLVDACPGSGKTSTCLGISKQYSESSIIMFTFNRQLASEVREKIFKNELDWNTAIFTYHGYGFEYYDPAMINDEVMYNVIEKNKEPIKPTLNCDILIIDECQDMKPLFFNFIKKVIADFTRKPKTIVILGDKKQGIYEFLGSDVRFLTHAEHLYPDIKNVKKFTLSISHRLTVPMVEFINHCMVSKKIMKSTRESKYPVQILNTNPFQMNSSIDFILKELDIKPGFGDDYFFLFPSTNMKSAQYLEHKLVEKGVRVVVARSDISNLDEKVIQKKAVICSYHQSKGRERKNVVVFGFDENYFNYYARDFDRSVCPPTLFVSASRALERLILVKSSKSEFPTFFNADDSYYEYIDLDPSSSSKSSSSVSSSSSSSSSSSLVIHKFSPSSITAFVKQQTVLEICKIFDECFKVISEKHVEVNFENTVIANDNVTFEDVSDLNGIVIPFIFESMSKSSISECSVMKEVLSKKTILHQIHEEKYKRTRSGDSVSDFFFYGNLYRSIRNNFRYYLEQMDNYTYLEKDIHKLLNNLRRYIKPSPYLQFEKYITINQDLVDIFTSTYFKDLNLMFQIEGAVVDIYDSENNNVYEIKCVDILQFEHKLQLVVYAWLFPGKKYWLLNARNGQLLQFQGTGEQIENIMYLLLKSKFLDKEERLNDEMFILKMLN
jgi:hypothetical protein